MSLDPNLPLVQAHTLIDELYAELASLHEQLEAIRSKLGDYPNDRVVVLRQHLHEIDRIIGAALEGTNQP